MSFNTFIMKLPKNTEIKKCIVCEKPYIKAIKGKTSKQHNMTVRSPRTVTCSSKCSKAYTRIRNHLKRRSK